MSVATPQYFASVLRDVELDFDANDGGEKAFLTLTTPEVLVQISILPSELDALVRLPETNWSERRTIKAGTSAGRDVHWFAGEPPAAAIASIGDDPETAQVSVILTEKAVSSLIRLARQVDG